MKGRRKDADSSNQELTLLLTLEPGDYGKDINGIWYCRPPWQHAAGCLGDGTSHHKVIEHEDGTITAHPSILIITHLGEWHGYLERGVWREC